MADVTPQDAIPATNASNATRYFNLPLFLSTDRPSWLVDWNGAMNEIDTILQDISTASETAVADVATIQTQINTLSTAVQNLNNTVETAVEDVAAMQTTVDSHETRMDAIEADLITQNNLVKSLSDAVTTMQATVATLNNRVAAIETTVSGYDARIDAAEDAAEAAQAAVQTVQTSLASLTSTVNGLSSTVSTHTSQISSLNTRVTALENSGGAGMPTVQDLEDNTKYTKNRVEYHAPTDVAGTFSDSASIPAGAYFMVQCSAKNTTGSEVLGYASCDLPIGLGSKISAAVVKDQSGSDGVIVCSPLLKNSGASAIGLSLRGELSVAASSSAITSVVVQTWTPV